MSAILARRVICYLELNALASTITVHFHVKKTEKLRPPLSPIYLTSMGQARIILTEDPIFATKCIVHLATRPRALTQPSQINVYVYDDSETYTHLVVDGVVGATVQQELHACLVALVRGVVQGRPPHLCGSRRTSRVLCGSWLQRRLNTGYVSR